MDRAKRKKITGIILFAGVVLSTGQSFAQENKDLISLPQVDIVSRAGMPKTLLEESAESRQPGFDLAADPENAKEEIVQNQASLAYGRFDTRLFDASSFGRTRSFYYQLGLNIDSSNGETPNSKYAAYYPTIMFGLPLDPENEIMFKTGYFEKSLGLPGMINAPTLDKTRENKNVTYSLAINHKNEDEYIYVEPFSEVAVLKDDQPNRNFENRISGLNLNLGNEVGSVDMRLYQNRLKNCYEEGVVNGRFSLKPWEIEPSDQLKLALDVYAQERFGHRFSPFIEWSIKKDEDLSHKVTLKRDFKPILFSQTYLRDNYVEVNPEQFKPLRSGELSYEMDAYISREWRLNLQFYFRQVKDYWFLADADNDGLYAPLFLEEIQVGGGKLSTEYDWNESFSNFFSLEISSPQSKAVGYEFVPMFPKQKFSAGLSYRFSRKSKIDFVGDYFGRRYYSADTKSTLTNYFIMSSKFSYEIKDYLTFFVLIDNLLNDRYETVKGYPNQSRSALSGIMVRF